MPQTWNLIFLQTISDSFMHRLGVVRSRWSLMTINNQMKEKIQLLRALSKYMNCFRYIPLSLNNSFKHYLLLANRSQEHNYRTFFLKSRNIFANKKFWSGDQTLYKYKYFPILWHQRRRRRHIKDAANMNVQNSKKRDI